MKTESKLLKYWNLATKIGIHEKIPKADVKHITLCNIIAFACIIQLLCFIPIFYTYWPETAGAFFSNLVLTLLYGLTLILNYRGYFLLARINIGITGLIGMSSNSIYSPQTPSQYAFLIAIFLHFFLYPPRQRYIMYIHALILGLLFIFFDRFNIGRLPPIPTSQELIEAFRFSSRLITPLFVAIPCFFIYITFWRAEDELAVARAQSERLLLNVLPESIAERLKRNPESIADQFDHATILFADIVNFTKISERMSPAKLVELLDLIFAEFDAATERLGLEKIKTIGDAYMVAGGIPEPMPNHTEAVADLALLFLGIINNDTRFNELNVRIGIHTGPIVAGVIGRKKFIYDLWGDSVNTASRMESHGVEGQIQVTEEVYKKIRSEYRFKERGIVNVKGKGELKTYFLIGKNMK